MKIPKILSSAAACSVLLGAAPATQAQIDVWEAPGTHYSYIYNPVTDGEPDVVAVPGDHFPLAYQNEGSTAFLFSQTAGPSSATWHFQLSDPEAIWSNDIWIKGGVLLIDQALADKEANYWVYEYSTDGVAFFPFFSTRDSDAGEPYHWLFSGAHSGSGAISLSRGGYSGGGQDLFIRLKAVNSTEQGVWMQALRTESAANRQFELNGSIVFADDAGAMVDVSLETAAPLNQSSSDSLNGVVGVLSQELFQGGAGGFTDASSATSPGENVLWQPDNAVHHVTWDLGDAGASDRQLDGFSVWLSADDAARTDYHGSIAVSMDGMTYVEVPGGHYANGLPQQSGAYNNVNYDFAPGQVIGFRYIRFTSYGLAADGDVYWQPRIVEVDAFVSDGSSGGGGFADWRSDHFGDDATDDSVSGPEVDFDGDGILNLFEYALGLDPKIAEVGNRPFGEIKHADDTDDYLTLSFRRPDSISDIGYVVEVSADLSDWSADAIPVGETGHEDGTTTFTYRASLPISGDERRFMRLQVTRTE